MKVLMAITLRSCLLKAILYLSFSCLVFLYSSFTLYADDDLRYWISIGPEGAPINSFREKAEGTEIIEGLILSADCSIFSTLRSLNRGRSWVALPDEIGQGPSGNSSDIVTLATDINNPDILYGETVVNQYAWGKYIGNTHTLSKSIDGGIYWVNLQGPDAEYRENFVMSQEQSKTFYATFRFQSSSSFESADKVMVSHNAGNDWQLLVLLDIGKNPLHADITKVYIAPDDSSILDGHEVYYENFGNNTTYVAKSYNAGNNWEVINTALYVPGEIFINRKNNQQLLMAYSQGVLRSENGGQDWIPSNNGVRKVGGVLSVIEDHNNTKVMYIAGRFNGLHHITTDGGLHCKHLGETDLHRITVINLSLTQSIIRRLFVKLGFFPFVAQTRGNIGID